MKNRALIFAVSLLALLGTIGVNGNQNLEKLSFDSLETSDASVGNFGYHSEVKFLNRKGLENGEEIAKPKLGYQTLYDGDNVSIRYIAAISSLSISAHWNRTVYTTAGEVFKAEATYEVSKAYEELVDLGTVDGVISAKDVEDEHGNKPYKYFVVYSMLNIPYNEVRNYYIDAQLIIEAEGEEPISSDSYQVDIAPQGGELLSISTDALAPVMKGDSFDQSLLSVTAHYKDNSAVILDSSKYTVTGTVDTNNVGQNILSIKYGKCETTATVSVGSYEITSVNISNVNDRAIVSYNGTFEGFTKEQFDSFNFVDNSDFQGNPYAINRSWDGDWGTYGSFQMTSNNDHTFAVTVDVTDFKNYEYTAHFGYKKVPNNNNGWQNMDLKFNGGNKQTVTIDDKHYAISFNWGTEAAEFFWGNVGLSVYDDGFVVENSFRLSNAHITKENDRAIVNYFVEYRGYTYDEVKDLSWAFNFQNNNNVYGNGWTTHNLEISYEDYETGLMKIKADVTDFESNYGYTGHYFANDSSEKNVALSQDDESVAVAGKTYTLHFNDSSFWNSMALIVNKPSTANAVVENINNKPCIKITGRCDSKSLMLAEEMIFELEDTTNWGKNTHSSTTTINRTNGSRELIVDLSNVASGFEYVVHQIYAGTNTDLEIKSSQINEADFEETSITYGSKKYTLKKVDIWNRKMVFLSVADN